MARIFGNKDEGKSTIEVGYGETDVVIYGNEAKIHTIGGTTIEVTANTTIEEAQRLIEEAL